MRKLDFFRLLAPMCAGTAAGACSLKKSKFLMFSKVLRKAPDQSNYLKKFFLCTFHSKYFIKFYSFVNVEFIMKRFLEIFSNFNFNWIL